MPFQVELTKIGLTDNQAAVYQAALSLGPSPVQPIARASKVPRGTTYVVLESLIDLGLVTRFIEAKKTLFVAEPPSQLDRLLDKREADLKEHRQDLNDLLPKLQAYMRRVDDRPTVRYYGGAEGLRVMQGEMIRSSENSRMIYSLMPVDYLRSTFGEDNFTYARSRTAKGVRIRTIFSTRSDQLRTTLLAAAPAERAERKFVSPDKYKSSSGLTIIHDRVGIGTMSGKIGGVVIESASVADMMTELFELAWAGLD